MNEIVNAEVQKTNQWLHFLMEPIIYTDVELAIEKPNKQNGSKIFQSQPKNVIFWTFPNE